MGKLKKRTVLITGVTGGIGSETAKLFAREGWDVAGQYSLSESKAKELAKSIDRVGARVRMFKADLSTKAGIQSLANKIKKLDIDVMINCAGTYLVDKHFSELTADEITRTFMVNTFAPMLLSSIIFKRMMENRFGRIVNISSIAAKYGGSERSLHYGCSKRALEGLTKTLARCGAGSNVLVNTLRLGVIDTDFHRKFPKDMKKRVAMIPLKKMGDVKDVAEFIYYLGSDKNTFITGETITMAGGE